MSQPLESIDVLVVEDDQVIGDLIHDVLNEEGYAVKVASNGEAALTLLGAMRPRLILLDMNMPGMTGWDFAYDYHHRSGPHAPIVVMTAAGRARERAVQIEAAGILSKPFDLDELFAVVRRFVDDKPRLRIVT